MIEWLTLWGVATSYQFVFKPILDDLAKDAAKSFVGDFLKKSLSSVFNGKSDADRKKIEHEFTVAAGKALKDFLQEVQEQLSDAGTPIEQLPDRIDPGWNLTGYAEAMRERYSRLRLESLDPTGSYYRELELWRVFIPQNVRECQEYLPQILELPREHLRRLREAGDLERDEPLDD